MRFTNLSVVCNERARLPVGEIGSRSNTVASPFRMRCIDRQGLPRSLVSRTAARNCVFVILVSRVTVCCAPLSSVASTWPSGQRCENVGPTYEEVGLLVRGASKPLPPVENPLRRHPFSSGPASLRDKQHRRTRCPEPRL